MATKKNKKTEVNHSQTVSQTYQKTSDKPVETLNDFVSGNYDVATGLAATYTQAVKTRKDFIKKFAAIKNFYLVDALLLTIADDALGADITSGEIFELSSENSKIDKELKLLQKRFDFDQIVRDIIVDLLANGEHTLSITSGNDGIEQIEDNIAQQDIVAFYKQGYPLKFLTKGRNSLKVESATKFAHFSLDDYKLRVVISNEFKRNTVKSLEKKKIIPKYARIGRPTFYGVLGKLKELELLEKLVPAQKINAIMSGNVLSVNVPESTEPKAALKIAKSYEEYLNKKSVLDRETGELTVANILTSAGKTRVLPVYGDGKGSVATTEAKENRQTDDLLSSIRDTREVICSAIGFPPQLLFGNESGNKTDILKQYGRYLRRLKSIQSAISHGLKQIVHIHFGAKGDVLSIDDINIHFRNKLINIEELEKEEFKQAMFDSIKTTTEFISDLSSGEILTDFIDADKYKEWIKNKFIALDPTLGDIFNDAKQKAPPKDTQPDNEKPQDDEPNTKDQPNDNEQPDETPVANTEG